MTYSEIVTRLEGIEEALAHLDVETEHPAAAYYKAKGAWEFAWSKCYLTQEGTVADRTAHTIIALYESGDYTAYVTAKGAWEAHKAKMRTLADRASIGQSLLKAQTREAPQHGPQPRWREAA